MALRWTAPGMLEAERQFRPIIGFRDLAKLALAIERDIARHRQPGAPAPTEEDAIAVTV
jgi:putative transposase